MTLLAAKPNTSVVGIAGPGDPFANGDKTMETLNKDRAAYPEMLLCVATNGMNIHPYLDDPLNMRLMDRLRYHATTPIPISSASRYGR